MRHATILGTFQSSLTDFKYLRKVWHNNTKEECLLGVSLTGIMDNKLTLNPTNSFLERLKNVSISTNKEFAKKLGINQSTAVTCVKPSGTVSQLVDSASGIHTRHSDYYIRAVRMDNKDPLTQLLKDKGVPVEPEISKPNDVSVFSFPIKSPKGAITRHKLSAIEQLEIWLMYQRHWCEHKPSATVTVKEDEWMSVGAWVYEHFDEVAGISFLPAFDHVYQQAPYQDITEKITSRL